MQGKTPELFRAARIDLLGKNIWENFPDLAGGDLHKKIENAVSQGKVIRVHGSLLPNQGWLEITIVPSEDGVECFIRDISDYRQTQNGPTHDEVGRIIFDALLESIPEGIIIADASAPAGHYPFLVVSRYAAEILGIPRENLLNYTLADLLEQVQFLEAGSERPTTIENHPLTRYIENGATSEDWEYTLRNKQGRVMTVSVKGGPVRNSDAKTIAGIFSWMDISERKQQEQRLLEYANRLDQSTGDLEVFASTASHDLQAPLRRVKGFSEILMKRYREQLEGEGIDHLERIYASATFMQMLMNDLLEFSRIGSREDLPVPVDLNKTIRSVLTDLELTTRRLNAQVEAADLPVVYADPMRMHQLFLNLIDNALKFHKQDEPPIVRVYANEQVQDGDQDFVQIAVEDNGIGFDISSFDRIVEPFQRLHSKSDYEGSGIGLAICRRILKQYGGELTATSTPGKGSMFFVTLPRTMPGES